MELKIYDKTGTLKLTASPNSSSTATEEVGGECAVSASFTHTAFVMLDVNDYIEVDGVRYKVRSPYRPTQKNTQTYEYSVKFYAPIHDAEDALMLYTADGDIRSEFSYDGGPRAHLQLWVDNMNRIAGGAVWSIGTVITGENKTIEYNNMFCWDAAFGSSGIAATFDTEMWADGFVINLCKASRGVTVQLGYMQGLTRLGQEDNGEVKFFTRLFPLGSTRNIDASKYGHARLQLPSGAVYVDRNTDLYGIKEGYEADAFSGIFPKYTGTVTSVRSEEKEDEDGRKYTVYYFKDSGMDFNPLDYQIPDLTFMLAFQTGDLAGRGDGEDGSFQAAWHEDSSEWEIINVWQDSSTQIPGGSVVPAVGDTYFPWNFTLPQEYITTAEQEYAAAVDDFLSAYSFDPKRYTGITDRNYIEENGTSLILGQNVRLLSDKYFSTGYKDTRIVKCVRRLNDLSQATITCSDQIGTGWKASVDNRLSDLQYEVARKVEQTFIDIIRTGDSKTPSNYNVFSALKSLSTHLCKDREDQTEFLQKFLGGIVTDLIESTDFVTGAFGAGFTLKKNADGSSYAELDKMLVRKKAYFNTLAILETELAGASFLFNSSGARIKITKVELVEQPVYLADGKAKYYADGKRAYAPPVYRCWFLNDDGDKAVENRFHVGNLARSQTFNIKAGVHEGVSNRYWWRLVVGVGDDYIDVSSVDYDSGSDIPAVDDVVVQLGDKEDPDYQAAIELSAFGDGAPYITFYQGINSYSMSGKDMFTIAYDRATRECYVRNYGRFYTGDREQTNYVKYSRKDGLEIRAKKIYLGAQDLGSEISGLKSSIEVLPDSITSTVEDATSGLRSEIKQTTESISLTVSGISGNVNTLSGNVSSLSTDLSGVKKGLKETGINISSHQITVTASNFLVEDNAGTAIAVFTHDEGGNPVIKAANIDVENLYVRHLSGARGDLLSGSIGGFTLANGQIGSANSGQPGSLSITSHNIIVGDENTAVLIGNSPYPAASGINCAMRVVSSAGNGYGTTYGAVFDVTGGYYNVALRTDAVIEAAAFHGRYTIVNVTAAGVSWGKVSESNVFIIQGATSANINMPSGAALWQQFGYTMPQGNNPPPDDFCHLMIVTSISSYRVTLNGIYNENGVQENVGMDKGDSIILLLTKLYSTNGSYKIVSRIH